MDSFRQTYAPIKKSLSSSNVIYIDHLEKMFWKVLSFPCPPLLNVLYNLDIPDSLSYNRILPWTQAGVFQLRHLVHPVTRTLLTFTDLQSKYQVPKSLFYSYLQIKHFFFSAKCPSLSLDKPTGFELMCVQRPYEPHLISAIYKILHEATPLTESSHSYMSRRSHTLQQSISLSDWDKIWESASKVSRCVAQRETAFKILIFWYRTPDFLNAHTQKPPRCTGDAVRM